MSEFRTDTQEIVYPNLVCVDTRCMNFLEGGWGFGVWKKKFPRAIPKLSILGPKKCAIYVVF